jgi:two-component system, cell cycle response regulator
LKIDMPNSSAKNNQKNIMVIDGSRLARTVLSAGFKEQMPDASVVTCASAEEALGHLNKDQFDIITISIMLPDMDGLKLSRKIRHSNQTHRYTPIIIVSGDADQRLLAEGFDAGVTDYFDKSLGEEVFVKFIKSFIERNRGLVGKVLYIEDSPSAAMVTRNILEKHGLQVTHVTCAEEALKILNTANSSEGNEFDIIITDFYLKGSMTGGDLLYAIRVKHHYSQQEMPVLVVTVSDNEEKQAEVFHAGANDFITKPIYEGVLIARVRSLITIKQQYTALAEKSNQLTLIASTDHLTGTRNKRYLLDNGGKFLRDEANQPAAAFLLDLDLFKKLNDTHGHITGDHVLEAIGALLNKSFADHHAIVSRFGGEELCVLIANMDSRQAIEKAEELRVQIEQLKPLDLLVTCSIGVCSTDVHSADNLTHFIDIADQALYKAKYAGRNRVFVAAAGGIQAGLEFVAKSDN